jgi:glycosyltransferase involved in cell wall biosynthesis
VLDQLGDTTGLIKVKQPTVCHICNFKPDYGGSFIDSIIFLRRYCLQNLGMATFCIFPEQAKDKKWLRQLEKEGIGYGFVPMKKNIVSSVRSLLHSYDPLVLHTHFFLYDISALALKCLIYRSSKVIWHYHNEVERTVQQRAKYLLKVALAFRYCGDRCVAVGDGVYHSMIKAGFSPTSSVLIHNGINTRKFITNEEVRKGAREALGISKEDTVFLLLGWEPIRKGVDVFIKSIEETLRHNITNTTFFIVGKKETKEFVSRESANYHVTHALRVIEPTEDFSLLLNAVDVLVSASRHEGLSYAVLEAMAAGKLILSSDISSVRETYGRSTGVWLFPTEDWKALARLIERAVALLPSERVSLGKRNSQYVLDNHSLEKWAERVGGLYRTVLQN